MPFSDIDVEHIGPGTLAGRYLRQYWQPVYLASNLPVKRAKPIRVLGEEFTLYRGESGKPYITGFRCAHRGTQLSTGWVRGENIRCLYHGWTYDGSGQCVEQPAEPEPFCQKVRIKAYPAEEYLGLIFAFFGEGDPPAMPRYVEYEDAERFQPYAWEADDCNWFNRIDQAGDVVHVFFAHPQLGLPSAPGVRCEETTYGMAVYADYHDGSQDITHYHMPNMNQFGIQGDARKNLQWRVPIDDTRYETFGIGNLRRTLEPTAEIQQRQAQLPGPHGTVSELGQAILRGDLTIDDVLHLPNAVQIEDYVVTVGQGTIAPREHDRLGREDHAIILLRKIWARELGAFAVGQPARRWERPGPLPVYVPAPANRQELAGAVV
ncbi:MAG: Rieske 2Fe-2S domain-containing protein [Chloroflexi bacterium]|nr:Rieske 2Fe-2S domain-containing protein [Chloroflexota bacterium]